MSLSVAGDRNRYRIRETRWIDYVLIAMMSGLALFATGEAIDESKTAWILIGILLTGSFISFLASRQLRGKLAIQLDGWFYFAVALVVIFFQPVLNQILPEDSFPQEIWTSGLLCWLLAGGSFFGWRDATLLFQAVPGLALFGLIGVYDTFTQAPFFFFGYLLCLALLFGRAHARAMLIQAHQSGFSRIEEGLSLSEAEAEQDSMLRAMRRGPWRWMAGPEWALASAAAVVVISLFGAPVIQQSMKGVSGFVAVNVPKAIHKAIPQQASSPESLVRIGGGPRVLSQAVTGTVLMDKPRYLRCTTYNDYGLNGWAKSVTLPRTQDQEANVSPASEHDELLSSLVKPHTFHFDVTLSDTSVQEFPLPAEVQSIDQPGLRLSTSDATVPTSTALRTGQPEASGTSVEPDPSAEATNTSSTVDDMPSNATPDVDELAHSVTASCKTDLDRANAISAEISRRCQYNLKAKPIPTGEDPVQAFLFDTKEGYCDLFGSSMVVMARAAGLKARYALGYLTTDDDRTEQGAYVIRQARAHAWAEVYLKGRGWVIFDPTGAAVDVTPKEAAPGSLPFGTILEVLGACLGILVIVYLGSQSANWFTKRHVSAEVRLRRRLGKAYARFADNLGRRAKRQRPSSATPDEWFNATRDHLGSAAGVAEALKDKFVTSFYSPAALSESDVVALEKEVAKFKGIHG